MKKQIYTLAIALMTGFAAMAQTTVLANFDFNESSSLPQNANTTASNITASINGTESDASYSGTATGSNAFVQNTTAGNAMSMSGNTNTNTWTLTMGGSNLYLYASYKLYFQAQRSSTGATTITLSYSTDGTNYTNVSTTASPGNGSYAEATIDMSSITAINNASALYIKFSGSGSTNNGGTLRMDNLEIQGTESSSGTNGNNTFFNGNVGIGTNNPAYPLDVVGAARISGALTSGATTVSSLSNSGATTLTGAVTTGALTSGAHTASSLTSTGNLSVTGTTNLTGAVTTGALTSGATNVSSLTNSGNLSVSGTTNLTGAVTTGALTSGATTVSSLTNSGNLSVGGTTNLTGGVTIPTIPQSGSGNRQLLVDPSGNLRLGGIGQTYGAGSWSWGGDNTPNPNTLGTTDAATDLVMITNNTERMRLLSTGDLVLNNNNSGVKNQLILKTFGGSSADFNHGLGYNSTVDGPFLYGWSGGALGTNQTSTSGGVTNYVLNWLANGRVGIGISAPSAMLHINTQTNPSLPGLIVDNGNPIGGPPEFQINYDGSTIINSLAGTGEDVFDVNFQFARQQGGQYVDQTTAPFFRISNNSIGGAVGIGAKYNGTGPGYYVSNYKMLTVNGDVSLANYSTGNTNQNADGFTAVEVLGNDQLPTRRGISVDNDPAGDFNFYINGYQGSSEFKFMNGIASNGQPATSSSNAQVLMKLDATGQLTVNNLPPTGAIAGQLNTVLVDNTGKLMPGAIVGSTSSAAWVLGGNSESNAGASGQPFGTTDATDVPIIAGSNSKEVMRVLGSGSAAGNVVLNTNWNGTTYSSQTQLLLKTYGGNVADANHGLGYFGTYNSSSSSGVSIDGPVLYGYSGGALATTSPSSPSGGSQYALRWDYNGRVYIGGQRQDPTVSTSHSKAVLQVNGDMVVGDNGGFSGIYLYQTAWSDFVFDKNYKLMPLNEVEKFYKENHHLPDVPTTKDIQEQGNNLGQTDAVLLQKIEELTLYMVKQQKEIEELKKQVQQNKK